VTDGGKSSTNGIDRRRVYRYRPTVSEGSLGWWKDSRFLNTPCRLIDVSLHGCSIECGPIPSEIQQLPVWFRALGIPLADWTEGTIIAVQKLFLGKLRVRIKFRTTFRYESFKAVVYGPDRFREPPDRNRPEHEKDHFWK
jgi:hypothetical protein